MSASEDQRRRDLYDKGLTDPEIAAALDCHRTSIMHWRHSRGLAARFDRSGTRANLKHIADKRAARMLLYSLNYSDGRIAREQGVTPGAVQGWRNRLGLPPVERSRRMDRRTRGDPALERIRKAVGRALPRDIADDAAADLYLAVLSGSLALDKIEAEARRFGNRVLDQFASRFGPRSLDEELGDSDGFRMIDLIPDDRSSSWLEEMGATVW